MGRNCSCEAFMEDPDGPRLWVCPEHGRMAVDDLAGLFYVYQEQLPGLTWTEFWDIALGVLAGERLRCRVQGRNYFAEDYLLADVSRHVETLAHKFGHPALAIPTPRPLELRELPWWRRWLLKVALPPAA